MGIKLTQLVDCILFIFFLTISIAAPLIDSQTVLPRHLFPTPLTDLKHWYSQTYGDYLVKEKPSFFVGLVWVELLLQWPMAVLGVVGILGKKPWLPTTCLVYGVSTFTSMFRLDYLVKDKPSFFVGLFWVEVLVLWPIAVLGVVGILNNKPWLPTMCLVYSVSTFTSMVAILAELTGSQRASDSLLMMYTPFLGAAILAIFRGLSTQSRKNTTAGSRHAVSRKKKS